MKELKFVCAQPATIYYAWQVEVMINNFIEMGVNPNNIEILCWKQNNIIPDEWTKLTNSYPVKFFFYDDTRETRYYISSIRPNLLKQHWEKYPELKDDVIFYHDCDIIFSKPIDTWITEDMLKDDIWYGSDTRFYIAHSYITSKGQDVIDKMCDIMELPEEMIKDNELNCIGAQYLMKNVTYDYWDRVESDCEKLYKDVTALNNQKKKDDPNHHELQIWCADMWAVLWGAWRLGNQTICHPDYEFSWATSSEEDYQRMNIMHNAGVTSPNDGLFYKASYISKVPYGDKLEITENTASWYYWNEIQKIGQKSCLL